MAGKKSPLTRRFSARALLRAAAGLTGLLLAATSTAPVHAEDTKATSVVLAVPAVVITLSAAYVADDMGIFKKNGLDVKTIKIAGVGSANAVISGSADFAVVSSLSLIRAVAKSQPLMAIAETLDRPIIQVVLRKDIAEAGGFDRKSPFKQRAALLRGRSIAVDEAGSFLHAYILMMAKRAAIDPKDIQVSFMQPQAMLAAFQTKQIDAFAMAPPWPLIPYVDGTAAMIASGPDGDPSDLDPFASTVVITQRETCQSRRPLCVSIGRSFVEAEDYIQQHPADVLAMLKRRFPDAGEKVLAAAFNSIREMSPNPPRIDEKGLTNAEGLNVEAGLMKVEDQLKSYKGLYTNEFVELQQSTAGFK
jgi:NitT/TauT family transport system substrate-binding protein